MQVCNDSPDSLLASFSSGVKPGRLIIVTGPRGSGKTSWCLAFADAAKELGIHLCGLISPAFFTGEVKTGIGLLDLHSGVQRHLADRRMHEPMGQSVSRWAFSDSCLKWGNEALAAKIDSPLFILDELGPLEFNRQLGLTNGIQLLSERNYGLACVVIRGSLLKTSLELWPWAEVLQIHSGISAAVPI